MKKIHIIVTNEMKEKIILIAEKYITVLDYKCSHCNKTFKSNN